MSQFTKFLMSNLLTILTMVGVLLGTLTGSLIKSFDRKWTKREVMYLQYPGDLFLRMLKCLIVPLLVTSITTAIGSMDIKTSGRIASRAIIYYLFTTVCAVILGIILVVSIRPGVNVNYTGETKDTIKRVVTTADTLMDLLRNLFPPNIIEATIFQDRTMLKLPADAPADLPKEKYDISYSFAQTTNVLGIVMFSIVLGTTIGLMREAGKALLDVFVSLTGAMMIITRWVIWLSPIGVFFLIAAKIISIESFSEMVGSLGMYFVTVMIGLSIHAFIVLPLIFFLVSRKLSFLYLPKMGQALVTAFGTGSSSATMPVTINCMDEIGVDSRVSRFVIPVGATINMDGTALYEAVAALFIAQLRKVPLSFGNIVAVSLTATAASIGAAGIPQAGLVTMVMVLDTLGLPAEDVSIIIAVDWLLDRFRTTINVMGDALGAILVDYLVKDALLKKDEENALPITNSKEATLVKKK